MSPWDLVASSPELWTIIHIPGEPVAQGRPRFARVGRFVRVYDPKKSREWKAGAALLMRAAGRPLQLEGPVEVVILAAWQVRGVKAARPRAKLPDAENVAKSVLDAGTGVLWADDRQVVSLGVEKWEYTAPAGVWVAVRSWVPSERIIAERGRCFVWAGDGS